MNFEKQHLEVLSFSIIPEFQENISKGKLNVTYTHVLKAFRSWSTIRISLFNFRIVNSILWSVHYSNYRKYAGMTWHD